LDIEDRDLDYEKKVQLQPHIVYLALSSEVKVGVTRGTQVPTRWIDQGATQAIPVVEVPNRYLAGITEVALKKLYTDKTNWQKMLKNEVAAADLIQEKGSLRYIIPKEVQEYYSNENQKVTEMHFPVLEYPKKVTSLNLDKTPNYSGKLMGIKGQYLIFEDGTVFNVRTFEGYVVKLEI
jgi:predicted transcriptional regulator